MFNGAGTLLEKGNDWWLLTILLGVEWLRQGLYMGAWLPLRARYRVLRNSTALHTDIGMLLRSSLSTYPYVGTDLT